MKFDDRGREAEKPHEIPKKGWKDILLRTKDRISRDNIDIVAAGTAFYCLLSIPFILTSIVSIYGIIADPEKVQQQISGLQSILPENTQSILSEQLSRISSQPTGALTFALIGSIILALWGATKAVKALITALNITYQEEEKRGLIKLNLSAFLLTFAGVIGVIVSLSLIAGVPALIEKLWISESAKTVGTLARWPLLAGFSLISLAVIYRYGPSREKARWQWVSLGSSIATVLWLVGSALFSWYVSSFGKYNETYGSLGAVVVLLMWCYVSAFIVLVGAELNAEMEHQTKKDTTTGKPMPMGQRGATMADTLGKTQEKAQQKKNSA